MKISRASNEAKKLSHALAGAGKAAQRRAFRQNIPVSVFENGKVFLIFPDNRKVEALPHMLQHYPHIK
ncbi:MAG: hypothetical protein U0T73_08500 [Chitinophagales bacterium]